MKKILLILPMLFLASSCAYLAAHPKVESDLQVMGEDMIRDASIVAKDMLDPPEPPKATDNVQSEEKAE